MYYVNYDPISMNVIDNLSSFRDCVFLINDEYRGDALPTPAAFKSHISAWAVSGINIVHCHFENAKTLHTNYAEDLGSGIYAIKAGFRVLGECSVLSAPGTNPPCATQDINPSVFKGLYHGIFAMREGSNETFTVQDASFENNIKGIYSQGVDFPTILQNRFIVGDNPYPIQNSQAYHEGIVINAGTAYAIEENEMITAPLSSTGAFRFTIGTRIDNTGAAPNQVYRNSYAGFGVADLANGNNVDVSTPATGLKFLCNHHTEDYADIAMVRDGNADDGIAQLQIDLNNGNKAAGNYFSQNGNFNAGDYYNDAPLGIKYYYNPLNISEQPIYYTSSNITIVPTSPNDCPANIDFSLGGNGHLSEIEKAALKSNFNTSESNYNALYYTYHQLIDDGNTNQLLQNIAQNWSSNAWTLRTELLARSPYLSEEAMKRAATEGVLPQAMLMEVLMANSDLLRNGKLLDFLQNDIPNPLSQYLIDVLIEARQTGSARTILETNMAQQEALMSENVGNLLRGWLNDSVRVSPDTIAVWLGKLHDLPTRYALVEHYFEHNQVLLAQQTLANIPSNFQLTEEEMAAYNLYLNLFALKAAVKENGRDMSQLNASEKESLQSIVNQSDKFVGVLANNILCFHYGICKDYPAKLPQTLIQQRKAQTSTPYTALSATVIAYPNPANEWVSLEYRLQENKMAVLSITDVMGKTLTEWSLDSATGIKLWDTREIPSGVYFYSLNIGNEKVANGKFVVTH
jgi:Secretion system C-terminal sorting domain